MKVFRIPINGEMPLVRQLDLENVSCKSLLGDNRPLMRHSDGALHAGLIETVDGHPRIGLFGFSDPREVWQRLASPVSSPNSIGDSQPATDSNQNGAYIAYVESVVDRGQAGYLVHIPDPFGDPSYFKVHGPLTPTGSWQNSFLQGSRGYNSVVYGWRDTNTGSIYVGVSRDGRTFLPTKLLVRDKGVVNGPAIGIRGDYVLMVYQTSNPAFAPRSRTQNSHDEYYYAWCESGDSGENWSEPAALLPDTKDLPDAIAYSVSGKDDLQRSEVPLSGAGMLSSSLQVLAWAAPSPLESRLFVMTSVTPSAGPGGEDWGGSNNSVGVLAHKPIAVGGTWKPVLTNRSLFRRTKTKPYTGRVGTQYKYSALPGTVVRAVAYVDRAPSGSELEDQIAILVSTNTGNSFDYEATFSASQLQLEPDAEIVIANSACCYADLEGNVWQDLLFGDVKRPDAIQHAKLPIGINVQDLDRTLSW
jgi:hypothetical protein